MRALLFIVLLMGYSVTSFWAHPIVPAKKSPNASHFLRVSVSPLIGFYSVNKNHAAAPTQRMSGVISIRHEIKLDRSNKVYFLYGGEYLLHGLNFKSYYFKPDSLPLYTKKFEYNYGLYIQEANIPLQLRMSFRNERNAVISPYALIGYQLRMLTAAKLQVTQNGNTIKNETADMKFKTPLLHSKINSGITLAVGIQKNPINQAVNGFLELTYRYNFSPYYFEKSYAAGSLFINSGFLGLNLGLRF